MAITADPRLQQLLVHCRRCFEQPKAQTDLELQQRRRALCLPRTAALALPNRELLSQTIVLLLWASSPLELFHKHISSCTADSN
jgi:hypothetical protein